MELSDFSDQWWYAVELNIREYWDRYLADDPGYDEWLQTLEPKQEQDDEHSRSQLTLF